MDKDDSKTAYGVIRGGTTRQKEDTDFCKAKCILNLNSYKQLKKGEYHEGKISLAWIAL